MLESPVTKDDLGDYAEMRRIFQKSVVTARAVPEGTVLTRDDVTFKKPGDGIPAAEVGRVVGRKARRDLAPNIKLQESDLT